MVGVFDRDDITQAADRLLSGMAEQRAIFRPASTRPMSDADRLRITPRHLAYLKISEGCDRLCTFCSIPSIRGKHVSKPIDAVVAEAEQLAGDGVRELIIVAQDTTYYGMDQRRPATARRASAAAGGGRRDRVDPPHVPLSHVLHRRAHRAGRRVGEDRPLSRPPVAAHQRPRAAAHEPPRRPRRDRAALGPACASGSRASCCAPR